MDHAWQIRSLHTIEDFFGNLEQVELQKPRIIRSSQARYHQRAVELQLAAHRNSQTECHELPQKKQCASTCTAVVYQTEKNLRLDWDEYDPMNPRNMSRFRKWLIVITISFTVFVVCIASSMYSTTYDQITSDFHCSRDTATLGLSLFVLAQGIGPPLIAPMSEVYGRQPIYRLSIVLVFVFLVPCAFAPNIQTLLIVRFFSGLSGSAIISIAGASIGDLFTGDDLENAMMVYTIASLSAQQIGSLVGGFINQNADWRWTFYVLMISTCVCLVAIFTILPETYHPIVLRAKARGLRKSTGDMRWRAPIELDVEDKKPLMSIIGSSISRPFQLLLLEPIVLNLCVLTALILGIVYLFFGAFGIIFPENHGFSLEQVGLSFQGLFIGQLVGILTRPFWLWYVPRVVARNNQGLKGNADKQDIPTPEPEYRLLPAITGGILIPVGLFWFAWTTFPNIHWIVPIIGSGVFGIGSTLIQVGVFTYLVDAYPDYSASVLAANIFLRSTFAAGFPFIGSQLYAKFGFQYAGTILAVVMTAMAPFPYFFYKNGKSIRLNSRHAAVDK